MHLDLGKWLVEVVLPPASGDKAVRAAWQRAWQHVPLDLPLQQRHDWPLGDDRQDTLLLLIQQVGYSEVAYVGLRRHRLRALPGAWYLQVPKLGRGLPEWAVQATLVAVRQLANQWWRVARVRVELCMLDTPDELTDIERSGEAIGYRVVPPQEYAHTLLLSLAETLDEAASPVHRSVYKNARKVERAGHILRPIGETRYADRLAALYSETMGRTGARIEMPDMGAIVARSTEQPYRYRLLGLFRGGSKEPEDLLAFRWCGCAGRYAYDLLAASTRLSDESGKIPMMPAIMLDMLDWARERGATHFDFGGVVMEGDPREAKLAGITRFKKQFGERVVQVGSDLILEPRRTWQHVERATRSLRRLV